MPKEVGVGITSPRAFRKRVVRYWFGIGTLLVVGHSSSETPPQGGVMYTVIHGTAMHDMSTHLPRGGGPRLLHVVDAVAAASSRRCYLY